MVAVVGVPKSMLSWRQRLEQYKNKLLLHKHHLKISKIWVGHKPTINTKILIFWKENLLYNKQVRV